MIRRGWVVAAVCRVQVRLLFVVAGVLALATPMFDGLSTVSVVSAENVSGAHGFASMAPMYGNDVPAPVVSAPHSLALAADTSTTTIVNARGATLIARATGLAVPVASISSKSRGSAAKETRSLKSLASEVREAGVHPAARNRRTIAVGEDEAGNMFIGSSNGLDAGQRAAARRLGLMRVPGSSSLHAEEELLRGVPTLRRVGTSVRSPCGPAEHGCAIQLRMRGVEVDP